MNKSILMLFLLSFSNIFASYELSYKFPTLVKSSAAVVATNCIPHTLGKLRRIAKDKSGRYLRFSPSGTEGRIICGLSYANDTIQTVTLDLRSETATPILKLTKASESVKGVLNESFLRFQEFLVGNESSFALYDTRVPRGSFVQRYDLFKDSHGFYLYRVRVKEDAVNKEIKAKGVIYSTAIGNHHYVMTNKYLGYHKVKGFLR